MPFDGTDLSESAKAIMLLDRIEAYFVGGKHWVRRHYRYGKRRCMLGALRDAAAESGVSHGPAVFYLLLAINPRWKHARSDALLWVDAVSAFNDVRANSYRDITKLLKLARYYAERDGSC
jgi:hypothetical protein